MFASHSIMFALLGFLAGANACIDCPAAIKINGNVVKLQGTTPYGTLTHCFYLDNNTGLSASCTYYTANGRLETGASTCPRTVTVKDRACRP
ncbi:uncharacterized protein EDB91DRAFT_1166062 [Suillus paluster]|uniref:uncharacterized protein n=1 Tax=Suillus paluster TaxID=48578 RepID=UPI001B8852C0|nr:uncharacterized protein EDB91DRAFT_1166062 [Suillus paluster]KAG1726639.1 hypothetical protein EDB91DRAFT_1166062 [Suillus paluster]